MMNGECVRVTVCELPNTDDFEPVWTHLLHVIEDRTPSILVLPELPFSSWFCDDPNQDPLRWERAVRAHSDFQAHLAKSPTASIYSVPTTELAGRKNIAQITSASMHQQSHAKRHLPNEPGYFEARWYDAGHCEPEPICIGRASVGVQLCTEMWDFEQSRKLGRRGVDVVAIPRTTPLTSKEPWICGGRAAAISAGAFCISSNRTGSSPAGKFAGAGWIIDPDGEIIAVTSKRKPVITLDLDLGAARRAKSTYPRYAIERE